MRPLQPDELEAAWEEKVEYDAPTPLEDNDEWPRNVLERAPEMLARVYWRTRDADDGGYMRRHVDNLVRPEDFGAVIPSPLFSV